MSFETRVWRKGDTPASDVLVSIVPHKPPHPAAPQPLRADTRLWIAGPKFKPSAERMTFLPEPPEHEAMPHAQRVIRDLRDHVHDPDWCFGRPKSASGFEPDLPPLPNGVARYDDFSRVPTEDPEAEFLWLKATQFKEIPTTIQSLHAAGLDATLLTESLADTLATSEQPDLVDRTSAPVLRRIEWEQEQAQNGPRVKFYLARHQDGGDDVTWWASKRDMERLGPEDDDMLLKGMFKVQQYCQTRGITLDDAENAIAERRWRADYYKRDHLYSRLQPRTLKAFFGTETDTLAFWAWNMPDEDPYRLAFVADDDDLHRPEPGYESQTPINEIRAAQLDAQLGHPDFSMGDLDQFGHWRLDQRYVDLLALRSFTNDSFISLDVDSTLELRDNEKRIVASDVRGQYWYSQWQTRRTTDYRWRAEDGSPRWIREGWLPIERADNIDWCDCRICRRWLTKERIVRDTVAAWRKRHNIA